MASCCNKMAMTARNWSKSSYESSTVVISGVNVILSHTYNDRTTQITAKKCNVFRKCGHLRPATKARIGAAKLLASMMANASSGLIIEN